MLLDITDFADGHELCADIVIIGAGAAGITMALALAESAHSVLILESGGLEEEPETQNLYAGSVVDARMHGQPDRYRQRRLEEPPRSGEGAACPLTRLISKCATTFRTAAGRSPTPIWSLTTPCERDLRSGCLRLYD